jgi:hypothetical protein
VFTASSSSVGREDQFVLEAAIVFAITIEKRKKITEIGRQLVGTDGSRGWPSCRAALLEHIYRRPPLPPLIRVVCWWQP